MVVFPMPFLARINAGERNRAGQQFQRAALGVVHPGRAREGEGRRLAAQIARQFEIAQGDRSGRRRQQEGGSHRREEACFNFHKAIQF